MLRSEIEIEENSSCKIVKGIFENKRTDKIMFNKREFFHGNSYYGLYKDVIDFVKYHIDIELSRLFFLCNIY